MRAYIISLNMVGNKYRRDDVIRWKAHLHHSVTTILLH